MRKLPLPSEPNLCSIQGQLLERGSLRYTPAGVPVIEFKIAHQSEQLEAENLRRVECELPCVVVGATALLLKSANPGVSLALAGFLASRSSKQKSLVLHVTRIEYLEH